MILRVPLLLSAIAGVLAVPDDVSYAFTGYGNVFGGGISAPGASTYEPLETAAAEPVPQKVAAARPASSVTVIEKPSKLRLARPPAVTVLPNAAVSAGHVSAQPGATTVTTYPAGAPAVTFQRPLIYAAPPPLQYVAAAPHHQVVFTQPGSVGVAAAQAPGTATKTVVAASTAPADAAAGKAKAVTTTTTGTAAGATVTSAGAAVVTSAKPTAVTVSRPLAVTYPPAQTYLFQRPAYAYPGAAAAAGVQAPVQVTYMRPLYQPTAYGLQPAAVAPAVAPAVSSVYQRPLVAYQHGAAAAPLTLAYPGALRTLTGAPAVYAAPQMAMPLTAAAPLVSAVHGAAAPVAAMPPYALARQVIAPFPGSVAVARPQLAYQPAAYAQPAYGAALNYAHGAPVTYVQAAVQPTQLLRQAKSKK